MTDQIANPTTPVVVDEDEMDRMIQEESIGTGGYIGQVTFGLCWKVYIGNLSNELTTFIASNKAQKAAGKIKAQELLDQHGSDRRPQFSFLHILHKDTVLNYEGAAAWQGDRYFVEGTWTAAGNEINENRKKFKLQNGVKYWAWLRTREDPYLDKAGNPKTEKYQGRDGTTTERPRRYWYIAEVFGSEEEAKAAVAAGGGEVVDLSAYPEAWLKIGGTPAAWDKMVADEIKPGYAKEVAGGKPPVVVITALANAYGVTPEDVGKALGVDVSGMGFAVKQFQQ